MAPKGSVVVIVHGYGTVLVEHTAGSRYNPGLFGYPAGMLERCESFKHGAVREAWEETGLELDPLKLLEDRRYFAAVTTKDGQAMVDLMLHFYEFDRRACRPALLKESAETKPRWADIARVVRGKYEMIKVSGSVMPHITDVLGDYYCGRRLEKALYRA